MAFGESGDKTIQLIAVLLAIYVTYVGLKINDILLIMIGVSTILYDGYLYLFEKN